MHAHRFRLACPKQPQSSSSSSSNGTTTRCVRFRANGKTSGIGGNKAGNSACMIDELIFSGVIGLAWMRTNVA
jgi:hypothetical protein